MPRRTLSRTTEAIQSDGDLRQRERTNNHNRQQRFEDSVNWVSCQAVVWVPLAAFFMGAVYVAHLVYARDWDGFRGLLQSLVTLTGGYLLGALQKRGLPA